MKQAEICADLNRLNYVREALKWCIDLAIVHDLPLEDLDEITVISERAQVALEVVQHNLRVAAIT